MARIGVVYEDRAKRLARSTYFLPSNYLGKRRRPLPASRYPHPTVLRASVWVIPSSRSGRWLYGDLMAVALILPNYLGPYPIYYSVYLGRYPHTQTFLVPTAQLTAGHTPREK